jgi:hypothetical protein
MAGTPEMQEHFSAGAWQRHHPEKRRTPKMQEQFPAAA